MFNQFLINKLINKPESKSFSRNLSFDSVRFWNKLGEDLVQANLVGPTIGSRAYAILNTAIYDAWAGYNDSALGSVVNLKIHGVKNSLNNKSISISFSAAETLKKLFPNDLDEINRSLRRINSFNSSGESVSETSAARFGSLVGARVANYYLNDGSNQQNSYLDYTGYIPVNSPNKVVDPSRWQPLKTPGGSQQALTPQWGNVEGFALSSGSQFRAPRPALANEPRLLIQAQEISKIRQSLTDRQKAIAEYWEYGAGTPYPPGKWLEIADSISTERGFSLDTNVKLFFTLSNALKDAGIAAWDTKYAYDTVRPITAIRELLGEKTFTPYLATPPFPEYVSGHSTFSAAAAEVLLQFTGSNIFGQSAAIPAGSSRKQPGGFAQNITLDWPYFSSASDQAGLSRIYGGIHFEDGDIQGRILGRKVGAQAFSKAAALFEGHQDFSNSYHLQFGDNGNNTLQADPANLSPDQIVGAKLYGYAGDDILWGGVKQIEMFGGQGADTFVLSTDLTPDIIRDFNPQEGDVIAISRSLFGPSVGEAGSVINLGTSPDFWMDNTTGCLCWRKQLVALIDGNQPLTQVTVIA
jgi:hypothetical protein